jgi:hypothetical protein
LDISSSYNLKYVYNGWKYIQHATKWFWPSSFAHDVAKAGKGHGFGPAVLHMMLLRLVKAMVLAQHFCIGCCEDW